MPQTGVSAAEGDLLALDGPHGDDFLQLPVDELVAAPRHPRPTRAASPKPVRAVGGLDARPRPVAAPPRPVAVRPQPTPAPPRSAPAPSNAAAVPRGGVAGRRTVTIQGRGAERYYPAPSRRRPATRAYERPGFRPDRVAMWAVMLGFVLVLIAAASSHAAMLVHCPSFALCELIAAALLRTAHTSLIQRLARFV